MPFDWTECNGDLLWRISLSFLSFVFLLLSPWPFLLYIPACFCKSAIWFILLGTMSDVQLYVWQISGYFFLSYFTLNFDCAFVPYLFSIIVGMSVGRAYKSCRDSTLDLYTLTVIILESKAINRSALMHYT